mgnify:CR=1 FL=1
MSYAVSSSKAECLLRQVTFGMVVRFWFLEVYVFGFVATSLPQLYFVQFCSHSVSILKSD